MHFTTEIVFNQIGLLARRRSDETAFRLIYTGVSPERCGRELDDRVVNGTAIAAMSNCETVFELTHRFGLNAWWCRDLEARWVIRPGDSAALRDAVVVGIRTGLVI